MANKASKNIERRLAVLVCLDEKEGAKEMKHDWEKKS
jgi:hypothetical protein